MPSDDNRVDQNSPSHRRRAFIFTHEQDKERKGKEAKGPEVSSKAPPPPADIFIEVEKGNKGQSNEIKVTIRECKAVAGRDGQADLAPVFESLKGCPTGLVTLLSPADGGPAAYTWSQPSVATDIPNLLIYGSGETTPGKGKKDEVRPWAIECGQPGSLVTRLCHPNLTHTHTHTRHTHTPLHRYLTLQKKPKKDQVIATPPVTIELSALSGAGPLRTGPWAAHNVAFTPSTTAALEGVPFEIKNGDADLSNVVFSGFEGPVFKVMGLA